MFWRSVTNDVPYSILAASKEGDQSQGTHLTAADVVDPAVVPMLVADEIS
jgi:hypothetical protein